MDWSLLFIILILLIVLIASLHAGHTYFFFLSFFITHLMFHHYNKSTHMCKCFCTCVCVPDLFTHVIWVYFICQNFWHTKNLTKKCRCFWTSFVFSVLEYTQFCIFSGIRASRAISSCCSVFLYCVLCCLGTELENSKWGLHFCCQVHVFAIFLEAMLKLILDYLTRTKWNGKELMEKVPKQWGEKSSQEDKNLSLA